MKFLRQFFITLFALPIFSAATGVLFAAQADASLSPEQLRRRIVESVGQIPLNPEYRLDGRFILSATGEEISYQAHIVQASEQVAGKTFVRRAADFTHENRTRNLRFFLSGENSWVASNEITVDVMAEQIPYMARFDFHMLYAELLDILARGTRSPEFRIAQMDSEVHVSGRLQNGWNAVFMLNMVEFYPRKIKISTDGEPTAAWLIPYVNPGNTWRPQPFPGWTTEFEIWMSNPSTDGDYRYARRIDFVERDAVIGGFFVEERPLIAGNSVEFETIFAHPPVFPTEEGVRFESAGSDRGGVFSNDFLHAMRSRLDERPWSQWGRHGRTIARLSIISSVYSVLLPYPVPPKALGWILISGYAIFLILLLILYRPRRAGVPPILRKFPRKTAITGFIVGLIMFMAGLSRWIAHLPVERSRMALHSAIQYAVTENGIYASGTNLFLTDFTRKAPPGTLEELGHSCQNYALAYDIIRNYLAPQRRAQIETDLFEYAKPLLGAASGWRANGRDAAEIAAGLGLIGLAIDFDPFITAAETVVEQILSTQLSGGLHKAGPGQGNAAMNAAANLFHGLRAAGRTDYYADERFQEYVSTMLKLLSPAGTLPFFNGTNYDDSLSLSMFFLKIADKMPGETGGQCVAANNLFMEYGIFSSEGWGRRIAPRLLPFLAYYENPQVMMQYESAITPAALTEESFNAGDGQFVALRAGSGVDAMYLALNMLRTDSRETAGDALSFDLFAKRSLMLHGSVFPAENTDAARTAGNIPLFNNEAQITNTSVGITSALLNQPVFDSARAVADRAYAYGQVKRDIVLTRPGDDLPGYFVIMDNISEVGADTAVRWRIQGRGETTAGLDKRILWESTAFGIPRLFKMRSFLEVTYPLGVQGVYSSSPGIIRSRFPFFNHPAQIAQIDWVGNGRICLILIPYGQKEKPSVIEAQGEYVCRIGDTDIFSFGDLSHRISAGSFEHVSEYSIIRDRGKAFPALIMAFGMECRRGDHSIISDKPVTASLDGLRGGIQNDRDNTRVTIRSPEIKGGMRFLVDGHPVIARESGVLSFMLAEPGTHLLSGS